MKVERDLVCIRCPLGCNLHVSGDAPNLTVSGNTCPRGEEYGLSEVTNPVRTVTSSIKVLGGEIPRVPVKTNGAIPKGKIFDCMEEILKHTATAPILAGDILISNVADTGVDIIATRNVKRL